MPVKKTIKQSSSQWLIPIFLIGIFFRFYNNTAIALWHDEAFSALYIRDYGWKEMMYRIGLDVHPPLYYLLLRLWNYVFGSGILSLRGFSILFGTLTIWAGYLFVKKAFGSKRLALLSAFMLAINPFQAQYSVEARMYTLGTFLILLSSFWLLKAMDSGKWKDWLIYGVLAAACIYTHYYLVFSVAAQGVYLLYWLYKNRKTTKPLNLKSLTMRAAGAYGLSVILFLPWLKQFLIQRSRVEAQYWIPAMDRWSIPSTIWKMIFGGQGIPQIFFHSNHPTLVLATLASVALLIYFIRRIKREEKWLIVFSVMVPFVLSIALSLQTAIYLDRYFVFTSLFFTILIACVLDQIPGYQMRNVIIGVFAAAVIFAFFKNWSDMDVKNMFVNRELNKKPGMAAAARLINEQAHANDRIYVGSSFIYFTFRYYNQTGIAPKLISSEGLDSIPHFSGKALLNPEDLVMTDTIFNHPEVKPNDNIWLLWTTGFGGSKPNVPGNWSKVQEEASPDAPGFKGIIYVTEYHVN